MTRALRILALVFGALLVIVAAAMGAAIWRSLPASRIDAQIPILSAPVQVSLDADGIPRIQAATDDDAATALGFVHARDRIFQMDLMRRAASGRLAELAGAAALPLDRAMRTFGLRPSAEAELAATDARTQARLRAYAAGVNAWIALNGRFAAPEFILLGAPEPWAPIDSLLWGKTMALYLSGDYRQELARQALRETMPPDQIRALWPKQDGAPGPSAALAAAARLAAAIPAFPAPFTQPETASNAWAVDAAHSASGAPLLAGDPHLAYTMPGVWHLARIDTPTATLAGATAPGVPFLVLGHNGHVAWSFTTTGADTQDVFIETPLPGNRYAAPDGPRAFDVREERIRVRGQPDDVIQVRTTRHGPVVSDLDDVSGPVLAVAMASLAPGDAAAAGLLALNEARTLADVAQASARITAPVQNLLAADKDGIALFTTGRVPIRRNGDGTLPVPGDTADYDWTGFASGPALPRILNPASGRLVNANERTAGPDFPVFMGADWFGDARARRIRALLDLRAAHSPESFSRIQGDVVSAFAQAVLPRLLQTVPNDAPSRSALSALRHWDGTMRADWSQPLLFNDWMRRLADALREQEGASPGLGGRDADIVARALGPDATKWCGPGCGALLAATLAAAAQDHSRDDRWGDRHVARFPHPLLGRIPVIGRLFTWEIDQPGDGETIFRGGARGDSWSSVHGPSYRGVYDLADLDRSRFAIAPGQSGNPFSSLAGNWLQRWRDDKTIPLVPIADPAAAIALRP